MSEGLRRRVLSVREGAGTIKIPAQLTGREWKQLGDAARRQGRSVTGHVSWLIRQYLQGRPAREDPVPTTRVAPVLRIRRMREVRDDEEMLAYWLTRPPEERVTEAERLRHMAYSIHTGESELPGIALVGAVVKRKR